MEGYLDVTSRRLAFAIAGEVAQTGGVDATASQAARIATGSLYSALMRLEVPMRYVPGAFAGGASLDQSTGPHGR